MGFGNCLKLKILEHNLIALRVHKGVVKLKLSHSLIYLEIVQNGQDPYLLKSLNEKIKMRKIWVLKVMGI